LSFSSPATNSLISQLLFTSLSPTGLHFGRSVGRSVKLLLVFSSFSLLEIHDQDFYSLLDTHVFRNGASSSKKEGSVFLCRRYVCCAVVSAQAYPRCHGVRVTGLSQCILCHCTILSNIYTRYTRVKKPKSDLPYDWRFTASQFVMGPDPLSSRPSRHGPHRKHHSYVAVYGPLPSNGYCVFAYLTVVCLRNGSTCHNTLLINKELHKVCTEN
jgi:hypothetical protein